MKFKMQVRNFLGIGSADIDFHDKGLVAIAGVNESDSSQSSNGAGKSSLFDAMCWCLWDETARDGLSASAVVNRTAKKDCEVVVTATEEDGSFYTISRWRKKSSAPKKDGVSITFTDASGVEVDLTKGTGKLTQTEIEKALGCTKEVFLATAYSGQEKLPNLPAMTDGELKQLIEKASGVDVLVDAYRIARDKLKDAVAAHDLWRLNHVRAENDLVAAQRRADELETAQNSYEDKRKDRISLMTASLRKHAENLKAYELERDSVVPDTINKLIAGLDDKINSVAGEQIEEENLASSEREAHTRLTTLTAHYNTALNEVRKQKANVENIASRIGQPCTECGKPCEEHDIEEVKKLAHQSLVNFARKAKELKDDVEAAQETVTERAQKLAEYRSKRTDIKSVVEERKRLAELLAKRKRYEDLIESETKQARALKEEILRVKAEENPFIELFAKATEELNDAGNVLRDSEYQGVDLEKRVIVCKHVVNVYSPTGVRAHVLDTITPFLNARTAEYVGTMSDGNITAVWSTLANNAKGELVEKFSITVEKRDDADSFAGLSGGEKRKVRLACAFALQDLVASRASKPIELAIYDEIDDALDTAGLERLFSILEAKGRDRGTLVVISHNEITDFVRQTTTVTRKDGYSTVSGVLAA